VKKFFLFKGNKAVFAIILTMFSHAVFPVTFKYNNGENLVTKKREEDEKEKQLKSVLDAIRRHNNKYVQFYLATEKNVANRKRITDEIVNRPAGVYGVNLDEASLFEGGGKLVDVNAKSQDGYTPIIVAIEAKNHEILKLLIENGANLYETHPIFNRTTLGTAAYYENEEAVETLLKKDSRLANVGSTVDGWTPLEDATLKENVKIVKMLLQYGANPTITDKHGGTPMDMATKFGKGEIVKILRDYIKANRGRL
jgi:ankyrin repeat-containing domain protein